MSEESILILNMLREGKITAEQADALLRAVRETAPPPTAPTPPIPPIPPVPPVPDPASLASMQSKLSELQSKLGELQGKIGAAQAARAAGVGAAIAGKVIDSIPKLDIDINKMVDEAMRGVHSFKNEAVRAARSAARQAGHEARRAGRQAAEEARRAAREGRRSMKWEINFDWGGDRTSDRPDNNAGQPEATETTSEALSWTGAEALTLVNAYGNVKVVGSEGEHDSAQVTMTKTAWAATEAEARVLLQQVFLTNRMENGKYRVEVVAPGDAQNRLTVDYEIMVPQDIPVDVETTHGTVEAEETSPVLAVQSVSGAVTARRPQSDREGQANLVSRSGDVRLEGWNAPGSLAVETVSGDIEAEGLTCGQETTVTTRSGDVALQHMQMEAVTIESVSGDVSIDGGSVAARAAVRTQSGSVSVTGLRTEQMQVETVSGDAELKEIAGTLTIKTVSGDIEAEGVQSPAVSLGTVSGDGRFAFAAPFSGSFAGTTVSGDLALSLWTNSDVRVEMNTTSGDLACALPLSEKSESDKHLSGKIGDGTGSVRLQSVSGDLHVEPQP